VTRDLLRNHISLVIVRHLWLRPAMDETCIVPALEGAVEMSAGGEPWVSLPPGGAVRPFISSFLLSASLYRSDCAYL